MSNGYRLYRRIDLLAIEGVKDKNKNENERENEFKSVKKRIVGLNWLAYGVKKLKSKAS